MQGYPLTLLLKTSKNIKCFADPVEGLEGKVGKGRALALGERAVVWVGGVAGEQELVKGWVAGDVLFGSVTFVKKGFYTFLSFFPSLFFLFFPQFFSFILSPGEDKDLGSVDLTILPTVSPTPKKAPVTKKKEKSDEVKEKASVRLEKVSMMIFYSHESFGILFHHLNIFPPFLPTQEMIAMQLKLIETTKDEQIRKLLINQLTSSSSSGTTLSLQKILLSNALKKAEAKLTEG